MVNVRKDWTLLLEVKLTTSPHARNDVFSCEVKQNVVARNSTNLKEMVQLQ